MKAYLTLEHGSRNLGTLYLELYDDSVPQTVQNFVTLLQRSQPFGYQGCIFHRIIPGFMAQGGDFTKGDGTGGCSIYDSSTFPDESFVVKHNKPGMLSMANCGPNTNGSQFFITFRPTPHLDYKHVVFGHVDLMQSAHVLEALEQVRTGPDDRPRQPVRIAECGIVREHAVAPNPVEATTTTTTMDHNDEEIDLEGYDDDEEGANDTEEPEKPLELGDLEDANLVSSSSATPPTTTTTKAAALKHRLRQLKQKMNQARQLNQQAVKDEGERWSRPDEVRKKQLANDKRAATAAVEARNVKALQTAQSQGIDGKFVIQQASVSLQKAQIRAEKAEAAQHSSRDYFNPQGQSQNYNQNLKSLPRREASSSSSSTQVYSTATFNPLEQQVDPEQERDGARRLADELHRRIEKQKKASFKRKANEDDDANHINQRNKLFNQQIKRNYDKHTAEIRQNLERGTAL